MVNVAENMQSHEQPGLPSCETTLVETGKLLWFFPLLNRINMPKLSIFFPVLFYFTQILT